MHISVASVKNKKQKLTNFFSAEFLNLHNLNYHNSRTVDSNLTQVRIAWADVRTLKVHCFSYHAAVENVSAKVSTFIRSGIVDQY